MATIKHSDVEAPIYINLSGDYKIQSLAGEKPKVGSISGDLRLASLDAFLSSLGTAMSKTKEPGQTRSDLTEALSIVVDRCLAENSGCKSVTLSITSKLSPEIHEMQYNFSVIVKK